MDFAPNISLITASHIVRTPAFAVHAHLRHVSHYPRPLCIVVVLQIRIYIHISPHYASYTSLPTASDITSMHRSLCAHAYYGNTPFAMLHLVMPFDYRNQK